MPRRKQFHCMISDGAKKNPHCEKYRGVSISFTLFRGGNTCNYSTISPSLSDVKVYRAKKARALEFEGTNEKGDTRVEKQNQE